MRFFMLLFLVVYIIQSRLFETQILLHIVVGACWNKHLWQISSKTSVLNFTLSKLWSVILQLSQNRARLRCFSVFLKNFFKYAQVE